MRRTETGDDLGREVGASEHREADRPEQIQVKLSTSSLGRRLTAAGVAFVLFATSGVLVWRALKPDPQRRGQSRGGSHPGLRRPAALPDAPTPAEPTAFVPKVTVDGDVARVDVTFPDGSDATVTYPVELDLASRGIQPDVSYVWVDDPPPRWPILFVHGPEDVEESFVDGSEPKTMYPTNGGVEAALWRALDTDFTMRRQIGWWLVLRTPSWSVLVSLRDAAQAETLATALTISEGETGLPSVTTTGPVELAVGFGESEGAVLALGDASAQPDVVGDLLGGTAFLSPDGCSGGPEHEGREYGSNCLGDGNVFASIYGDEGFVDAVLDGLRVEAFTPAR